MRRPPPRRLAEVEFLIFPMLDVVEWPLEGYPPIYRLQLWDGTRHQVEQISNVLDVLGFRTSLSWRGDNAVWYCS
jgi:hypothetical protein